MPRYFVDIFAHEVVIDQVGHDYPTRAAMQREVRRTLTMIMRDAHHAGKACLIRAEVRDEAGRNVLRAALMWVADSPAPGDPAGSRVRSDYKAH